MGTFHACIFLCKGVVITAYTGKGGKFVAVGSGGKMAYWNGIVE